jgi:hypothetical protein
MSKKFKLTKHYQYSKKCEDGKKRNFLLYFLNDVQILKQKIPFNERYDAGHDRHTAIYDDYLYRGRIYQTRTADVFCGTSKTGKTRNVSYPISKIKLQLLEVPFRERIDCE